MPEIIDFTGILDKDGEFKNINLANIIHELVLDSEKARRNGLLDLESELDNTSCELVKWLLESVISGVDQEFIISMAYAEMETLQDQLSSFFDCLKYIGLNQRTGNFDAAFSLLIKTKILTSYFKNQLQEIKLFLKNRKTKTTDLSENLTTFLEISDANLITELKVEILASFFNSILKKNQVAHKIILAGVTGVQNGLTPRILEESLLSFVDIDLKKTYQSTFG